MRHAVVLDIGSSKVVSICAGRVGRDGMAVYGADIRGYSGYRFGAFKDNKELQQSIIDSLLATQRESGLRMREVAVSVPAPFTKLYIGTGEISFDAKPKRITDADIDMLIHTSLPQEQDEAYVLMHSTPLLYTVDGNERLDVEMETPVTNVSARVSHVYASKTFLDAVYAALEHVGACSMCVSALLCEALLLLPERDKPAVLTDIGHTHTDVCVLQHGAIVAQTTIEVGGMHFASDLAYGLGISQQVAEFVKRRYVFGLDYQDSVELIRTPQGTRGVEWTTIQYILEERAKELCSLINSALFGLGVQPGAPIQLTGGGIAMMRGSREFMEKQLSRKVVKDMPWMPRMNSPNYASAFGTLEFVMNAGSEDMLTHQIEVGMLRRLKDFFVK